MKITSSYAVKIRHYSNIFKQTVKKYQDAVSFFIDVCDREWDHFLPLRSKERCSLMEHLCLETKDNPSPKYSFNERFYKMPTYLRRAAINAATGAYSSYWSLLENWEADPKGSKPTLQRQRNMMPVLYNKGSFLRTGETTARIKIFHQNDWVWLDVDLNQQDVNYIKRHCSGKKELSPTLLRKGKRWCLVFPYEEYVKLTDKDIRDQVICAVDLGINCNAACSIMYADGTVAARKFINLKAEKDRLDTAINRVKRAQQHGSRKCPTKWKHVNDINLDMSRKTAAGIMEFAAQHQVDVIVFEHLNFKGKKRGKRKQRLALWRKREVQKIVEHKAHQLGMRIRRVNPKNTSALAYDGSGPVLRGWAAGLPTNSLCRFSNGKVYNCDLNASYNIGARYFIREFIKSNLETGRLPNAAEDPRFGTGSTRTCDASFAG